MMPGQLNIFTRVEDLPPIWETVARTGGLGHDTSFLHALQQSAVDGGSRRYLVYETPCGAAVIAVAELLQRPSERNPVMNVLLGRLNKHISGARNWLLPMLVLRADVSSDAALLALASTRVERAELLRQMLHALDLHAARERWSLALTGVPGDDAAFVEALTEHRYLRTMGRPYAELPLGHESWQAFLSFAASRSKNAAAKIRREINCADREGVIIAEWDPKKVSEAALHELMAGHELRRNSSRFCYEPGLLSALADDLGDHVRILVALRGSETLGAGVLAWAGERGYVLFPGMVARAERAGMLYFNLAYYQPIRLAIELGLTSLAYGNGAFQAKIRRGCRLVETALFFRPRHSALRSVLRPPLALHRHMLARKYEPFRHAPPFSFPAAPRPALPAQK